MRSLADRPTFGYLFRGRPLTHHAIVPPTLSGEGKVLVTRHRYQSCSPLGADKEAPSWRTSGRRAPALAQPKLWGTDCPSFARCCTRSCAARRRASAPSQGKTVWAHEGISWSAESVEARNAA